MQKQSTRMIAPDILKIAAAIFVVVIHHKQNSSAYFVSKYQLFHLVLFAICFALGLCLFVRERAKGSSYKKSFLKFGICLMAWVGFSYLKKFPVAIFLVLSSYFLAGSISKSERPLRSWYTAQNLISRIARFYIPFLPLFIIGLIYKIFVLKYDYTIAEVVARFILGGFKPGSYYITILAELVLVFPVVYVIVHRFKFGGVLACALFTFAYDIAFAYLGLSDVAYKFLIFRFAAHIAFGIYGKETHLKWNSIESLVSFSFGLVYVVLCVLTKTYKPPVFFQWQEASFPTAFFIYPVIAWFITVFKNATYTNSALSRIVAVFAGATYHIFLIQLLYYTTFGFALNEYINNFMISMPLNLVITLSVGVLYYKHFSPVENMLVSKIRISLEKNTKL